MRNWEDYDQVGAIMQHEQGDLDDEGTIELFQNLVDTGMAWSLQGCYGRAATAMIEAGVVSADVNEAPEKTLEEMLQ